MTDTITVLLADDHPAFRRGVRAILAGTDGIDVIGEASTGEETIAKALELQPDVILMDLHMPPLTGIEATRSVLAASPRIAVLVVTMHDDDDSVFAAMRAGARGYLLKGATQHDIRRGVTAVASGDAIFGAPVAQRMLDYFAKAANPRQQAFPELTEREAEILDLIARGLNNTTIAEMLNVAAKTIRNHVSNIFTKLQVLDRAQAIVRAREAGLGTIDERP